jgi:WD40 repeat protein
METVIESFGKARLLSFDHDPATRSPTVEVAHEALLREWPRLRDWLNQSRADIRLERVLGNAAEEWLGGEQDPSFLLRGARLDQFAAWSQTTDLALTQMEGDYLEASLAEHRARQAAEEERLAHEAALERRSRNFLRALVVVFALAAVVAIGLTIFAFNQRQQALVQASIGLASQAEQQAKGRAPETSVLLALEALENYPYTWQAERALGVAILNSRLRLVVPSNNFILTVEWSSDGSQILASGGEGDYEGPLENANARILDTSSGEELLRITDGKPDMARWSPDETSILALNTQDMIVKVWDVESGEARITLDKEDIGGDLGTNVYDWKPWSPNGDRFVIYTTNGQVKIFDALTGDVLQALSGHDGYYISQVAWSPEGDLLAVTSRDPGTTIVYQADTGQMLYEIPGGFESAVVVFGSWSPNGDRFVTRGLGGAKVYEAATGKQLLDLSIPESYFWRALWSPDGARILTDNGPESATVWDADSGQVLSQVRDVGFLLNVDLSPSGNLFLASGRDGFVHVFDAVTGQEFYKLINKLTGAIAWPYPVQFSPDGESIVAVDEDNTINIFDLTESSLSTSVPTCSYMTNPAWSPDGKQVAFGSTCPTDYPVKIWDSHTGEQLFELRGNQELVEFIHWSPSGDRILTTFGNGSAKIWDAHSFEPLLTFTGRDKGPDEPDWSPDGSLIVSPYDDGLVVIWDSFSGEWILTFADHAGGMIRHACWSPDGSKIISTSDQGEALIWDATTGEVLSELLPEDFKLAVSDIAWTKDGERVILLSEDGFVRIFDSRTGKEISQFFTRAGSTNAPISISPEGDRIIIGGYDNVASVWDIATGAEMITYEADGYVVPAYSPDGTRVLLGNTIGDWGRLQIFPVWDSLEELIDYAKECCVVRELTPDEREVFGLPPR